MTTIRLQITEAKPFGDGIRAKRWADDRFLNDRDRSRKRAGFQHDLQQVRFVHIADSGDLRIPAGNLSLHDGRRIHHAIEYDRNLFVDVGMGYAAPYTRSIVIHLHRNFRLAILLIDVRTSLDNRFDGKLRLAIQEIHLIHILIILFCRQRTA